ncbi:MAG: CHRD domain-containing protein [Verrucomicrobia subdivision 3 bacterium]|nr:CHRD domain-containing protein [Limisphaerales bacterium]
MSAISVGKVSLWLILVTAAFLSAGAQDSIRFTNVLSGSSVVPPNSSPYFRWLSFSLAGNTLQYFIRTDFVRWTSGAIHGPAPIGQNAPSLFDLGLRMCEAPLEMFPGACFYSGTFMLTDPEVLDLLQGLWYVRFSHTLFPDFELRGQVLPADVDFDGVPDFRDECPSTSLADLVDANGCSLEQYCPCEEVWRNHGEYLECVKQTANKFGVEGVVTDAERRLIVSTAARSDCGKGRPSP